MPLRRSGEANRFPRYPFDPHTKRELLTLDPLGLPFAREVLRRFQLPCLRAVEGLKPIFCGVDDAGIVQTLEVGVKVKGFLVHSITFFYLPTRPAMK